MVGYEIRHDNASVLTDTTKAVLCLLIESRGPVPIDEDELVRARESDGDACGPDGTGNPFELSTLKARLDGRALRVRCVACDNLPTFALGKFIDGSAVRREDDDGLFGFLELLHHG